MAPPVPAPSLSPWQRAQHHVPIMSHHGPITDQLETTSLTVVTTAIGAMKASTKKRRRAHVAETIVSSKAAAAVNAVHTEAAYDAVASPELPRRSRYTCKQCGELKKGHWCKVLYV